MSRRLIPMLAEDAVMDDRATLTLESPPFEPLRLRITPGGGVVKLSTPNLVLGRHSHC